MPYFFISFIWWHGDRPEDKKYSETLTDMSPLEWLINIRAEGEKYRQNQLKEHPTNTYYQYKEVYHIIYAYEIRSIEYKSYKDELS